MKTPPGKQLSFADAEYQTKRRVTRRERFLTQLDALLPWAEMQEVVAPHYAQSGKPGRQPIGLPIMLRVHVSQIVYNYSDPGMEDALYEVEALRRFCGINLNQVPDESSILLFRHLLEEHGLAAQMLERINHALAGEGLLLKTGTIVDASIISAPSSTKNATGERDPEMHQTKKGEQWYHGAKLHVGVDADSGLVHSVSVTAANVADIAEVGNLLHGSEEFVQGDAGYQGVEKREELHDSHVKTWVISIRPGTLRKLTQGLSDEAKQLKAVAKTLASHRAKVEHVFRDIKIRFGYAKVRYRGLAKNASRMTFLAAIANVLRGAAIVSRRAEAAG